MATAKKTQIVITANAAVAKKVMDELQQRIDAIKQKMQQMDPYKVFHNEKPMAPKGKKIGH